MSDDPLARMLSRKMAKLAALPAVPAPRPRVEGEELVTAAEYADRDPFVVPMSRAVYRTLLHHEAEVIRLTAEVERLTWETGELRELFKQTALALGPEWAALAARLTAALALPTNGANGAPPEAKPERGYDVLCEKCGGLAACWCKPPAPEATDG